MDLNPHLLTLSFRKSCRIHHYNKTTNVTSQSNHEQKTEVLVCGPSCRREGRAFTLTCLQSAMHTFSVPVQWSYREYILSLTCLWRSKFPPLSSPVFFTPEGLEQSIHFSHAKLLMLLQSAWFCPSWTIATVPWLDCHKRRSGDCRQSRMQLIGSFWGRESLCMTILSISCFLSLKLMFCPWKPSGRFSWTEH